MPQSGISRRRFLGGAAAAAAGFLIVPRNVLGGAGYAPPCETMGGALIGCGGRGFLRRRLSEQDAARDDQTQDCRKHD